MTTVFKGCALILALFSLAVGSVFAQDTPPANAFGFKMSLDLGAQTFNGTGPDSGSFNFIGLSPDISFGKFGVGLDLIINYTLNGPPGAPVSNSFYIRASDWVPTSFQNFLSLYLSKFAYVRWGEKGDPLFIQFGSFKDANLGDGFIMGNYNNTLFMPNDRHLGLQADLDGGLVKFPFVGLETVVGNVATMDVLGGRIYVRPLMATQIPIFNNIEVGFTGVVDTGTNATIAHPATPVAVFGGDVQLPLVYMKDVFSLSAFTDLANIAGKSTGAMVGVGGKVLNLISYGAQLRLLGAGFEPGYFSVAYDSYDAGRGTQYLALQGAGSGGFTFGWSASMGTSFFNDKFIFLVKLDGPFYTTETDPSLSQPHLTGILSMAEGVIPGATFDFIYDKTQISSFASLVSPLNALIRAQLNFLTGGAVISFVYNITYDLSHTPDHWVVQSGLQSSIPLF